MLFTAGDKFEQQFVITDRVYEGFIRVFNDKNPLHTDEAFALARGFKGRVMHGNILNGFLSYFIGECLPVASVIIHSQEIQYKNAVYLNDVLLFDALITGVFESVKAVEFKFSFKDNGGRVLAKGKFQIGVLE